MYIPRSFAEEDLPTLHAFLDVHPLATIVTHSEASGFFASHIPLVLERAAGPLGTLRGHLARANPHAKMLLQDGVDSALVIFTGPDAYVTPDWYRTKQETARVVPTWNYIAVHAYCAVRPRDDAEFLRQHLETLTGRHEAGRSRPWKVSDAPEDFLAQQMKAIVAVEFAVERLEGKWKMSQNRAAADIDGVIRGLGESESARDHAVAEIVAERRPKTP